MAVPQTGDVLIRVRTNTLPTSYAVVEAATQHVLGGPYASMAEAAIAAARHLGPMARVWQDYVDRDGRPLGPPRRFPLTRP